MGKIKNILRRMVYGNPPETSEQFADRMRAMGMRIGQRTIFFDPASCTIDVSRPWLIEIGDDVQITHSVTILTHGYDWSVMKGMDGRVLGSAGKVTVGNNVFIGMNTTILKGVTVGNNVVIGAGSLVNKDIPDNCVAAGNPVRVIMPIEEYYEKRKAAQEAEAKQLVAEYRKVYGKEPDEEALSEFFWLFTDDPDTLHPSWQSKMELVGTEEMSREMLKKNPKPYRDMQDFLDNCK